MQILLKITVIKSIFKKTKNKCSPKTSKSNNCSNYIRYNLKGSKLGSTKSTETLD